MKYSNDLSIDELLDSNSSRDEGRKNNPEITHDDKGFLKYLEDNKDKMANEVASLIRSERSKQ